jgi:hypothetical protein
MYYLRTTAECLWLGYTLYISFYFNGKCWNEGNITLTSSIIFHRMQHLFMRYTLDVMHYEMNLAKNFLKTICRNKDTVKVRRDLQRRGIRRHLWLTANPRRHGKMFKPAAPYELSNNNFKEFVKCIESLKMPTGYASSLGKHVRSKKFGGLKSHDYYLLMQQILPLALRGLLELGPWLAVMHMCRVFRRLYTMVYNLADFK